MLAGVRVLTATAGGHSLNASWNIGIKTVENRVVTIGHLCFTQFFTEKVLDVSPLCLTRAGTSSCKALIIVTS